MRCIKRRQLLQIKVNLIYRLTVLLHEVRWGVILLAVCSTGYNFSSCSYSNKPPRANGDESAESVNVTFNLIKVYYSGA